VASKIPPLSGLARGFVQDVVHFTTNRVCWQSAFMLAFSRTLPFWGGDWGIWGLEKDNIPSSNRAICHVSGLEQKTISPNPLIPAQTI
jgi:hypothetical protein